MYSSKEHTALDQAYAYFNEQLFAGTLSPCFVVLINDDIKRGGHHWANRWSEKGKPQNHAEIALNANRFTLDDDRIVLSTLVHEMAHHWQHQHGKPTRNGYHNRQWAAKMQEIGLMPSDTGQPGGKTTGQNMGDYIITDGPFDHAVQILLARGWRLNWQRTPATPNAAKPRKPSKVKYTCPDCEQNAWAKPAASLICGLCQLVMEAEEIMEEEEC